MRFVIFRNLHWWEGLFMWLANLKQHGERNARWLVALYFGVYAVLIFLYPESYRFTFGSGGGLSLVLIALILSALALAFDRGVALASLFIFAFMSWVQFFSFTDAEQLVWAYLGWVLIVFVVMRTKIATRDQVLNVGWILAGLTYTLQGIGKLVYVGKDWMSGTVVTGFAYWTAPSLVTILYQAGVWVPLSILISAVVLAFHFSALPLALVPRLRAWLWMAALTFHVALLGTRLYFVSLGMIAFWSFLGAGLRDVW